MDVNPIRVACGSSQTDGNLSEVFQNTRDLLERNNFRALSDADSFASTIADSYVYPREGPDRANDFFAPGSDQILSNLEIYYKDSNNDGRASEADRVVILQSPASVEQSTRNYVISAWTLNQDGSVSPSSRLDINPDGEREEITYNLGYRSGSICDGELSAEQVNQQITNLINNTSQTL
jgi:hypothetical protein